MYLEAASFGGVQYKELFEQVLTVGGHVERNPVFAAQHALSQLLVKDEDMQSELMEANINFIGLLRHIISAIFRCRSDQDERQTPWLRR